MSVFETETDWVIALYEKHGRIYREIGVFLEGAMSPLEAFDAFAEVCVALPPWQVVSHALSVEADYEEGITPAYEVRLCNKQDNRVVATVLWDSAYIETCKDDHKQRNMQLYTLSAEVELDEEDDIQSPEDWDWETLVSTGKLRVLDISPVDGVEYSSTTNGEENNEI